MDLLDFWIFSHTLNKTINEICKLICSVNFVGNKSCDYKTQGFGLLIKSCYSPLVGIGIVCHYIIFTH